jgi:hypothetical protein
VQLPRGDEISLWPVLDPALDGKSWHPREMTEVVGHQDPLPRQGVGRDEHVEITDRLSPLRQQMTEASVSSRGRNIERGYLQRADERVDQAVEALRPLPIRAEPQLGHCEALTATALGWWIKSRSATPPWPLIA